MATSLTKEQFLEKAKAVHGDRFSYEKSLYRNMRKPIKIVCSLHGEFEQSPMNHLKTDGCPKCGYLKRNVKTEQETSPEPIKACSTCDGTGKVKIITQSIFGQMVNISTCPDCKGHAQTEKPKESYIEDATVESIKATMKEADDNLKAREKALHDRMKANFEQRQEDEHDPYVVQTMDNIEKIQKNTESKKGFIGVRSNVEIGNSNVEVKYQSAYKIHDILEMIEEQPPHMVVNKSLLNILVTDDMLDNAYKTGYIIYEKVDAEDLNNVIDRMTTVGHRTEDSVNGEHVYADEDSYDVKMISTSIKMEWNSICHNSSFTLDHIKKYKDKISPEYLIHSPAFLIHTSKHELKKADNILTLESLKNLKKRFPKIVTTIRLAPDWFDSETKEELYSWYVLPRMINYGSTFSDKIYKMYKDKMVEFFGHYLTDSLYDISITHKAETVLNALPEIIFRPIFTKLNKRLQKHYISTYLKKHFITDEFMEDLIGLYGIDYCMVLSQTQVPSLKFMEKYEKNMKPILVLKNMVRNSRVIDTYIEKYIDELLHYDSVRHDFFKKSEEFNTEGLDFSEALFTSNKVDSRFAIQNQEYSVDLLQAINLLTDNKMYKKLYTLVRTHKPESDLIASLQQELESMLSQSKKLNDKFNTLKKVN